MTRADPVSVPEFSRPVSIARLPDEAVQQISATAAEREALAQRFGLLAVDRLDAEVRLRRIAGGIRLAALLDAEVTQQCVVTLDPVPERITDRFALVYSTRGACDLIDPEADAVEPLEGDEIDIGEAVAQQLSLAIDPYPHAPGARLKDPLAGGDDPNPGPFANLARLRSS